MTRIIVLWLVRQFSGVFLIKARSKNVFDHCRAMSCWKRAVMDGVAMYLLTLKCGVLEQQADKKSKIDDKVGL